MLFPTHNTVNCKVNKYMNVRKEWIFCTCMLFQDKVFKHWFIFFFFIVYKVHSWIWNVLRDKFITVFPISPHFRMLLLNYLGKMGTKTPLKAAATFSVGWNTFACSESLEKPLNWLLFNYYLTTCLQSSVNKWVIFKICCLQNFWITYPNNKKF